MKMKQIAFFMALLLSLSLAACTPENTKPSGGDRPSTDGNTGLDGDSPNADGQDGDNAPNTPPGNGVIGDDDNDDKDDGGTTIPGGIIDPDDDGSPSLGEDYTGDRRFYYAGRLYEITNEKVDPADVGAELFSITDIVENDPAAEGEGMGLDLDTNIFKFKEENEYDELVVKLGSTYYKATVREDDMIPDNNGDSGTNGGGASNDNGSGTTGGSN